MPGKIYLIQHDKSLQALTQEPYPNEDGFQSLLEQHPDLLAADQMNEAAPRWWLLVVREMGVPGEEGGLDQWSLDHLFLDQDGIPTLVEVKRASDTRIRREVVGQMLDYAANAVVYWSVETVRTHFEAICEKRKEDPAQLLAERLGVANNEAAINAYWRQVKTNGWVRHMLESAVWGLLTTDSFEEAVVQAVNLGDDADTAGAVVGALASAAYGLRAIPTAWRAALHGEWPLRGGECWDAARLVALADRLTSIGRRSSSPLEMTL